jgi:hypothetical protein
MDTREDQPDTPQEGLDQGLSSDERFTDEESTQSGGGYDSPAEAGDQDDESVPEPGEGG